jgi:hypothetical protein
LASVPENTPFRIVAGKLAIAKLGFTQTHANWTWSLKLAGEQCADESMEAPQVSSPQEHENQLGYYDLSEETFSSAPSATGGGEAARGPPHLRPSGGEATRPKLVLVDEQRVYLIGRNTECSLVIAEPAQPLMGSGLHAYIYFQPDTKAWCLKDFSLNGTSVNGARLDKNAAVHLVHGDKVQFGTKESVYTFVFWNPNGAAG